MLVVIPPDIMQVALPPFSIRLQKKSFKIKQMIKERELVLEFLDDVEGF